MTTPSCSLCSNKNECRLYNDFTCNFGLSNVMDTFVKNEYPEFKESSDYVGTGIRFWVGITYCPKYKEVVTSAMKRQKVKQEEVSLSEDEIRIMKKLGLEI